MTAVLLALLTLAGCNTTKGFGEDVKATGEIIEETADEARDELAD